MAGHWKIASQAKMKTLAKSWIFAGILVGSSISALSQPAAPAVLNPDSQKIGLVLEGGGALGLAHIGVITWLEEHHIPVSYVAGTSMGGLVGGVYATGRSPCRHTKNSARSPMRRLISTKYERVNSSNLYCERSTTCR